MCLELSESGVPELFAAFAKAQSSMGDVLKQANNPAFKSKYADLGAVVEAVVPALNANGLALIQAPGFDGETIWVETIIAHGGGGFMRNKFRLRPSKSDPQGLGSAITYGRRYGLMAICGVAPEDDDGNAASGQGQGGQRFDRAEPAKPSAAVQAAAAAMKLCKSQPELDAWKADNKAMIEGLPAPDYDAVVAAYRATFKALPTQEQKDAA